MFGLVGVAWKVVQFIAGAAPEYATRENHPGPVSRDLTMALPDDLTYDGQTIID
jgi:hypothetical protein